MNVPKIKMKADNIHRSNVKRILSIVVNCNVN